MSELKAKSCVIFSENDEPIAIGIDPKAETAEIAEELFHAFMEKGFLQMPHVKNTLQKIAEHVDFQSHYQKYLEGRTYATGEELLHLEYETQLPEIAAHIMYDI